MQSFVEACVTRRKTRSLRSNNPRERPSTQLQTLQHKKGQYDADFRFLDEGWTDRTYWLTRCVKIQNLKSILLQNAEKCYAGIFEFKFRKSRTNDFIQTGMVSLQVEGEAEAPTEAR